MKRPRWGRYRQPVSLAFEGKGHARKNLRSSSLQRSLSLATSTVHTQVNVRPKMCWATPWNLKRDELQPTFTGEAMRKKIRSSTPRRDLWLATSIRWQCSPPEIGCSIQPKMYFCHEELQREELQPVFKSKTMQKKLCSSTPKRCQSVCCWQHCLNREGE